MRQIPLSQGKFALVDDQDFEWLGQWKWSFDHGYATRKIGKTINKNVWITIKKFYMHREILKVRNNERIDHKDTNGLNNQKHNLRICTQQNNSWNQSLKSNNKTGFKGVYWSERLKKYLSHITVNYKRKNLGWFKTKEEAAFIYNQAAKKYFGEFAKINNI